ncbi:MAG: hypothetical protein ABIN89_07740 [Chitinophagaceae bacterium]
MDTPLVSMVMPEFTKQFKAEATWGNIHRNAMTVYKTNGMRIVRITLHQETILKKHTGDDIISVLVLEGKIFF